MAAPGLTAMPGMDLHNLNSQELRRLLEAAQARNQQDLTERLTSELRSRSARAATWRTGLPGPQAEADDARAWWRDLRQDAEEPTEAPPSKAPIIAAAAAAVALAAGLGWGLSPPRGSPPERPVATALAPAPQPPSPALAPAEPAPVGIPAEAPRPAPAPALETPGPAAASRPPIKLAKAQAKTRAAVREASAPIARGCRAKSTAADRLVCGDAALAAQHRQMRRAYDRALEAGADPLTIDRGQARWRAARSDVTDRAKLARLYASRIRELEAAAWDAKAEKVR